VKKCDGDICRLVPAVRCKIERKMVTKRKPETRCERVPRQFCRKEACEVGQTINSCYFRTQVVSEMREATTYCVSEIHLPDRKWGVEPLSENLKRHKAFFFCFRVECMVANVFEARQILAKSTWRFFIRFYRRFCYCWDRGKEACFLLLSWVFCSCG